MLAFRYADDKTRAIAIPVSGALVFHYRNAAVYCSDYRCSHSTAISGDRWPDDVRLSDLEPKFACQVCGHKGADVRPNFSWDEETRRATTALSSHRMDGAHRRDHRDL